MQDLKKIETGIIQTMILAYSSYYGRELTPQESADCTITINQLREEIACRKKDRPIVIHSLNDNDMV
jgi:hypothetical protein